MEPVAFTDLALHAGIGTVFGLTGALARKWCKHLHHQILAGAGLICIESYFVVALVG